MQIKIYNFTCFTLWVNGSFTNYYTTRINRWIYGNKNRNTSVWCLCWTVKWTLFRLLPWHTDVLLYSNSAQINQTLMIMKCHRTPHHSWWWWRRRPQALTKCCAAVRQSWVRVATRRGSGRRWQGTVGGRVRLIAVSGTDSKRTGLGFAGLEVVM